MSSIATATPLHAQTSEESAAAKRILDTLQESWNRGDSARFASVFTPSADFVNIRGQVYSGRAAIGQQHAMILAGPFKGSQYAGKLRYLRPLAPGVLLLATDTIVTHLAFLPPGVVFTAPGEVTTHFLFVMERQRDGGWQLSAAQNTAILPPPPGH